MKRIVLFIFIALGCMCVFSSSKVQASTIELDGTKYTVNTSNEYNSDTQVEWITISSDRSEGARVFVEFDINSLKDYNSRDGLIYYSTIKKWLNKLEEVFDYFCELNIYPKHKTLVIEWNGVSEQMASAYAPSNNNRIIMNKEYHNWSLRRMQNAADQGIIDICGTVLHEMGHKFTASSRFTGGYATWDVGVEYINIILVQHVLDNLIKNNNNIVSTVFSYYTVLCASEEVVQKGYNTSDGIEAKLYSNYATCWEKIKTDTGYENIYDLTYVDVLANYTKMLDVLGEDVVKKTFSTYFTDSIDNYNTSTYYYRFITFTEILKSNTSDEEWEKVITNYNELYNKYVVNLSLKQTSYDMIKGRNKIIDYEYSYNSSEHDDFIPEFSSRNTNIATVNSSGIITAHNEGTTQIKVKVGNQCELVTVNVLSEDTDILLKFTQPSYTITEFSNILKMGYLITPNGLSDYLEWYSSDNSVATVNTKGVVTPVSNGKCTITAKTTDGTNLTAECEVIVDTLRLIKELSFSIKEHTINSIKQMPFFVPTIIPSDAKNKNLNWTSSDESVATVSIYGRIKPISNGTCKITATTTDGSDLSASIDIIVDIKAQKISFDTTEYTITNLENQTPTFHPIIEPSNAANKEVKWSSSDENIATVSSDGVIKAVSNGTCKITATTTDGSNLSASINITVNLSSSGPRKGDINQDGMVNVNDVIYGGKGFTKGTLTEKEKEIGNVNGDSVFNINDLIKIMKYVVGKIKTLD